MQTLIDNINHRIKTSIIKHAVGREKKCQNIIQQHFTALKENNDNKVGDFNTV